MHIKRFLRAWTIWALIMLLLLGMVKQVTIINGWDGDPQQTIIMLVAVILLYLMIPMDREK